MIRKEFSSGGVITDGERVCVIVIRNIRGAEIVTLPKGHVERGETPRMAALREAEEETGCRCEILRPAGRVRYSFQTDSGDSIRKTVQWYLMRLKEITGRAPDPAEISEVRWLTFDEAERTVRYPSDRRLVKLARQYRQPGSLSAKPAC
ncbi:MAG: NUDIX hydrolase [Elusimicrobiaceae bacterium]|nr:NUDIX hydrolase [Elusimicrobiaceae bacterium]